MDPPYLSPELLNQFQCGNSIPDGVNRFKSDVYSLGLTLLECMTLKSSMDIYNYKECEIRWDLQNHRVEESKNYYSKMLCNVVDGMLSKIPENRADFIQLQAILKPHRISILNLQPFEISLVEAKYAMEQSQMHYTKRF